MSKIGRNQPCPCGSRQKYKRCHGRLTDETPVPPKHIFDRLNADQQIRERQQGLGRPIVAFRHDDYQMVAVGNQIFWSKEWKAFPDFLSEYVVQKLGADWCKAEIANPLDQRHPLMQWYDTFARYQQQSIKKPGEVFAAPINGVVACFLGTAYSIYLLDHNAELQARLIHRLKDPGQFQGAYYELIVANTLIRAGFQLTLEDETDGAAKHCEFAAISKSGKRYWVEAKMRAVVGQLGRTTADGGSDSNPMSRMINHLNGALKKPAADDRLIFIDLNAPVGMAADGKPDWLGRVVQRLERYERDELPEGFSAYVFLTNFSFHRDLLGPPIFAATPFGLGLSDFNRPGMTRISDAYRLKQKYIDAHSIFDSLQAYLRFPSTFDGDLPSQAFRPEGERSRVVIGQTYFFEELNVTGTVTAATADIQAKEAMIAIVDPEGKSQILKAPMSDTEVSDYREFGRAYFGQKEIGPKQPKDVFQMFEWFMEIYRRTPRDRLVTLMTPHFDVSELEKMTDEDLRIAYCESLVAAFDAKIKAKAAGSPDAA